MANPWLDVDHDFLGVATAFGKFDEDATEHTHGVLVTSSDGGASSVVLDGVNITGADRNGFAYIRAGYGGAPSLTDTIDAILIIGGGFTDNGDTNTGSGGRGAIMLYGFNGTVAITETVISSLDADIQKAIQIRGVQEAGYVTGVGMVFAAGTLDLSGTSITGGYLQDAVAICRITSFAGVDLSGLTFNGTSRWGAFNLDAVGATFDLTQFTASNGANLIGTLQGLAGADSLTGSAGNDLLDGRDGVDTLAGGTGDDIFRITTGAHCNAGAQIVGGLGTDTVQFTSAAADTLVPTTLTTPEAAVTINMAGALNTVAMNFNASAVGGGLTITGNAAGNAIFGTASGDTISGNDSGDSLVGGAGNQSLSGGTGADTLQSGTNNDALQGGDGGDILNGGAGLDAASYQTSAAGV